MSNEPDEVNSGALATMIVIVALSTLAVALVVTSLVRDETRELRHVLDQSQERGFRQLRAEQVGKLTAPPAWTDRAEALVSIPIDRAMTLVLEAARANPYSLSPGKPPEEEETEEEQTPEEEAEEAAETQPADAQPADARPSDAQPADAQAAAAQAAAVQPAEVVPAPPAPVPSTPAAPTPAAPTPVPPAP